MTNTEDKVTPDAHTHENDNIADDNQATEKQTGAGNDQSDEITALQQKLTETEEIMKKAQYDYVNLKMDFDGYVRRAEENAEAQKQETLFNVVKKFLPFVESLRKSIDTIPEDKHDDPMSKGVILTYNKFLQTLEWLGIKPIESIGLEPDSEMHEPVSMQPTEDENMKGKIIQEFERGFYYEKGDTKKVITTSKVIIGQ